ncbi:MAG TPA: response regulator [Gemmataceae bacterium]|nr:response regulator [Gemmataceae bacterium]
MKPTLLIADGDAELCDIYHRFFAERGYEVETALDGLDCLTKLRRTMPAVLVLDHELHWGGGDGVLAWLREQRAPSRVRVVLTTTESDSANVATDIRPPVVTLLPKPFTLTTLLENVRAAVAGKEHKESLYLDQDNLCSEFLIG